MEKGQYRADLAGREREVTWQWELSQERAITLIEVVHVQSREMSFESRHLIASRIFHICHVFFTDT